MVDPFLFLTPVLMLAVLALVRFVGCNQILGLPQTELPQPPIKPGELRAYYGNGTVTLRWGLSPDAVSYRVKSRDTPQGLYTSNHDVLAWPWTYTEPLPYDATRYYVVVGVSAAIGTTSAESEPSNEVTVTGARGLVTSVTLGTPRSNFIPPTESGWVGMVIAVQAIPLTVVALGRVAGHTGRHILKIVDANGADVQGGWVYAGPLYGVTDDQFRYQTLEGAGVDLSANTTYYVVTHETQPPQVDADQWFDYDTVVQTHPEAVVQDGILQDDANPGIWTPSGSGVGHTYGPMDILYHPYHPVIIR